MRSYYAICPACSTTIAGPTVYTSRLDGQAQLHARVTGHAVDVIVEDDPDEVAYTVPGQPGLYPIGPGLD